MSDDKKVKKPMKKDAAEAAPNKANSTGVAVGVAIKKKFTESKNYRGVIRIVGKDLKGELDLMRALSNIKGIGQNLASILARIIENQFSIAKTTPVGELTDDQIGKIESVLKEPSKFGVKQFMLNRRRDIETGKDKHIVATDLTFQTRQDIQRHKDTRDWVGWRHLIGQKVRGQRTRNTGRTGMSVGVLRKQATKAGGAAQPGAKEEKK